MDFGEFGLSAFFFFFFFFCEYNVKKPKDKNKLMEYRGWRESLFQNMEEKMWIEEKRMVMQPE